MFVSGKFPYVMKTGRALREVEIKARARVHLKIKPQAPPYLLNMNEEFMELADVRNSRRKFVLGGALIMSGLCLSVGGLVIMASVEVGDLRVLGLLFLCLPLAWLFAADALEAFRGRRCRVLFNRETGQAFFYGPGEKISERPWRELFFCIGGRGLGPGPADDRELSILKLTAGAHRHNRNFPGDGYADQLDFNLPHYGRTQMDRYPVYLFCHLLEPASRIIESTWAFGGGDFKEIQSHWNFISDFLNESAGMKKPR